MTYNDMYLSAKAHQHLEAREEQHGRDMIYALTQTKIDELLKDKPARTKEEIKALRRRVQVQA